MLRKVLSKSGRRILRAIKKLSTKSRLAAKKTHQNFNNSAMTSIASSTMTTSTTTTTTTTTTTSSFNNATTTPWQSIIRDPETISLSWSLPSLDTTNSVDTDFTYLQDGFDECSSRCCYCLEHEENQRNENRENEMIL